MYLVTYSNSQSYFSNLLLVFIFVLCIFMRSFYWIRIRELGVSSTLNRGPNPNILLDLIFSVVKFDRFQFQSSFFNILDFS